jgi:hypothetical protein
MNLTNPQKAALYDDYIRESDRLQRVNSKIKSENVTNVPANLQQVINENDGKIAALVIKLEKLFN